MLGRQVVSRSGSKAPVWASTLVTFLLYGLCLALLALIQDARVQPGLWMQVEEFLRDPTMIVNDPRTFAKAAVEVSSHGWLTPSSEWIFRLWPPGFVLLEAAIFKVLGENVPFLVVLLGFTVGFGAWMLLTVRRYLGAFIPPIWATLLPLVPFLFPVTRFFLLQPLGLAFGEGFSVIFFLTAAFMLLQAAKDRSIGRAAIGGAFLALAAYFRSQYELIIQCMTAGALFFGALLYFLGKRKGRKNDLQICKTFLLIAGTSMIVAQMLLLPWRIHNYLDSGRWTWVHTQELVIRNALTPEKTLVEVGGSFVITGGGHLACKFEPTYCNSNDKSLFYKAFSKHVFEWYHYKVSILGDFWLARVKNFPFTVGEGAGRDYLGNSLMVVLMAVSVLCVWLMRKQRSAVFHAWLLISFYGCFFVVFSLVQFEVRYFFLVKIFALFSGIVIVSEFLASRRKTRGQESLLTKASTRQATGVRS